MSNKIYSTKDSFCHNNDTPGSVYRLFRDEEKNSICNSSKYIAYPACFRRDENNIYYVEFPDLPGCLTQGSTLEEAICMAQEALAIYCNEIKTKLPTPTCCSSIIKENPNILVQLVAINRDSFIPKKISAIKKTLSIPEWLNDLSLKYQVNFSQILKDGLIYHLKSIDSLSEYDRKMLND